MFNISTYCVYGDKESILKVYLTFEKLMDKGVISQSSPWMGNMVMAFGKSTDDYPCRSDFMYMYIRDYEEEPFTRLYIETSDASTPCTELVELLISEAKVENKVNLAYCIEFMSEHAFCYSRDADSFLFDEPDDDALMSTISSYWLGETSACEIAEAFFGRVFRTNEELESFLAVIN